MSFGPYTCAKPVNRGMTRLPLTDYRYIAILLWMFETIFFKTSRGDKPVLEFIKDIDNIKDRAKVFSYLDRLEKDGFLPEPYSKSISGIRKLRELRIKSSSNVYRIFYFISTGGKIILLHAFSKKTQKTPKREIEIAIKRMNEFLEASHEK